MFNEQQKYCCRFQYLKFTLHFKQPRQTHIQNFSVKFQHLNYPRQTSMETYAYTRVVYNQHGTCEYPIRGRNFEPENNFSLPYKHKRCKLMVHADSDDNDVKSFWFSFVCACTNINGVVKKEQSYIFMEVNKC